MSDVKDALLQANFINASIELAKLQVDEDMANNEKMFQMNLIFKKFKKFISDNYDEK